MKVNKIVLIEDEKPNSDRLKRLLISLRPKVEIVTTLVSVQDAIIWFTQNEMPDLVMMDVRLADGNSFEIFNQTQIKCPIIFTTAYDEYAVKAFKYNSIDYLLKPIEKDELLGALNKFESLTQPTHIQTSSIQDLLSFIQPKEYRSRFLLPYRDSYKTVLINEIAFFYSELNITYAKLFTGGKEIIPQTLENLELQLNPKDFFRTNRKYIVNINAIQKVHNHFNGKLKVELKNNPQEEVLISREKKPLFKTWMDY
ncbi:LytTR family DNA-binding domain-containing protein [Myroides pelagicus]|uniref:LytR/AlgR family response regulator transcription factor n=1 Tax=Myroides pelagicus TaxID=270914 RepID=UPI002DB855D0|nr:LytTR family DNA-binding domain-containing protein [Myroides pelagicus]MEC4115100.1 LytTR family DNA-binding domain-containing protein [Myroides pelagicus]